MPPHILLPDGRSLHWCEYGAADGLPIFQFHGTPGSRLFGLDSAEVASAGLRVVTPERPGYGRSSPHPGARWADHVSDVATVADALGISRFHVLGVSGGGPLALGCAAALLQRVWSATVVAGPAPGDDLPSSIVC